MTLSDAQTQSVESMDDLNGAMEVVSAAVKPMTTSLSFTTESTQDKRLVYSSAPSGNSITFNDKHWLSLLLSPFNVCC